MITHMMNIDSQSVIDIMTEDEAEDNTILVEQQNDHVHHEDEEQQQSSAQLLQHMAAQHVVTSQVESEQPTSFSSTQTCPDKANQPANYKFPKCHFGKTKLVSRSFQLQWFQKWKWLHYDEARDLAFCHICSTAVRTGKMKNCDNVDLTFIDWGFHNCEDASGDKGCFNSQEQSKCHNLL